MNQEQAGTVLVVDDNAFVLETTSLLLKSHGFNVFSSIDPEDALRKASQLRFDAVLTDIKMPKMTGLELLERLKAINEAMPVILMTAYMELDMAVDAVKKGAFDFIIKPYKPDYLVHAIKKAINYARLADMERNYKARLEDDVRKKTEELNRAMLMVKGVSREIAVRMTAVSEFRDTATGAHVKRIGLFSGRLSEALSMPLDFVETITFASTMHDLGKIGIPDSILLKAAALGPEEFETMKQHTVIGAKILAGSEYPSLQMAARIALSHHERWDGTGYPKGLKAGDIPIEGRIVMLVDQYDALRSRRPYKDGYPHEEVKRILTVGDKRTMPEHFDPAILDAFIAISEDFDRIFSEHSD